MAPLYIIALYIFTIYKLQYLQFTNYKFTKSKFTNVMKYELWWGQVSVDITDAPQARLVRVEKFLYSETRPENPISQITLRVRTTDEEPAFSFRLHSINCILIPWCIKGMVKVWWTEMLQRPNYLCQISLRHIQKGLLYSTQYQLPYWHFLMATSLFIWPLIHESKV